MLKKHKQCLSCHGLSLVQMMFSSIVTAVHLRQLHRTSTLVYFLTPSSVGATTLITFYGKCPGRYLHFAPLGRNWHWKSRRQYYVSVIQPDLEYGSTAFSSSLSAREKARLFQASRKGVCAITRASPWTPTTPLLKIFGLAPLSVRFDLKLLLLTHRCVHSIASPLLCRQYKLRILSKQHVPHNTWSNI